MKANLRFSGSCGITSFSDWLRIFEYDLFNTTTFYTKLHIYEFLYKFDTVSYKLLETGTSDRCLICIVEHLRFSGFILYPLSFFLYNPFKGTKIAMTA